MKEPRLAVGLIVGVTLCAWVVSAAQAEQNASPETLEGLQRMVQEVAAQNRELAKRVRELEAELTSLKAEMTGSASSSDGELVAERAGEPSEEHGERSRERAITRQQRAMEPSVPDATEAVEAEDLPAMINEYVLFGGAIEVEGGWGEGFDDDSESEIRLETAELDFEVLATAWATAALVIEWDDEEDQVTIDEAFITLSDTDRVPVFVTAGRFFVPFGVSTGDEVADTLSITDPLTIEIFETREDAVLLGAELDGAVIGAYAFKGDSGEDQIDQFGATARFGMERGDIGLAAGVDIISSVFDTDELAEAFPEALDVNEEFGLAAHLRFSTHGFSATAEYNGALREVDFLVDGDAVTRRPQAWQLQGAYAAELYGRETFFDVTYSGTDELGGAFAESRLTATVGRWLSDNVRLSFEYLHEEDYSESRDGTGNSADAVTGQLTYEW